MYESETAVFEGQTAVITGGASGIGLGLGRRLGGLGATVVLADLDEKTLDLRVDELVAAGIKAFGRLTDVTDQATVDALAQFVMSDLGGCDLLFNNAGVAVFGSFVEATQADWDFTMGVNFQGVVNGLRAFVPGMASRGSGHIVNTASMSGLIGMENLSVYCASKFAVVGLTESLRRELAPAGIGVTVLCPMVVDTPISENSTRMRPADLQNNTTAPEVTANLVGGVIAVEDVADLVVEAIRSNQPYVLTHPEQASILGRRAARLAKAAERLVGR